jgi:hypothetical protein
MSKERVRLARLVGVAVAIALVVYVVYGLAVSHVLNSEQLRASGEPDTAEVAIRVRNFFHSEHAVAATCGQSSAGRWTCSVRLADGRQGSASAVWHDRPERLIVSLDPAGFR